MFIPWWILSILIIMSIPVALYYWNNYSLKHEHLNALGNDDYLEAYLLRLIYEHYERQVQYLLSIGHASDVWESIEEARGNLKYLTKNPREILEDDDDNEIDETDEEALRERVGELF